MVLTKFTVVSLRLKPRVLYSSNFFVFRQKHGTQYLQTISARTTLARGILQLVFSKPSVKQIWIIFPVRWRRCLIVCSNWSRRKNIEIGQIFSSFKTCGSPDENFLQGVSPERPLKSQFGLSIGSGVTGSQKPGGGRTCLRLFLPRSFVPPSGAGERHVLSLMS